MPILQIKNLSTFFHTGNRVVEAVKNISFDLHKKELLAIVGESGSGKSVMALSVLKLLPYPAAFHPSGQIIFDDKDLIQLTDKQMTGFRGNKISMVLQEPMTALNPLHTIEKQIKEPLFLHMGMDDKQAHKRCLELLELVELEGLKDRLNAYPHNLSGGQRQRIMIAIALACNPKILIADEPTTALDVTVQKQILELLKKLQNQLEMGIILITHDLHIVEKYAEKVCVMYKGEIVEAGDSKKVLKKPQHEYTKRLLAAKPGGDPVIVGKDAKTIVSANKVNVTFTLKRNFFGKPVKSLQAVRNAIFDIKQGETLGIVGESGSGKSTLAMAILRLLSSNGEIIFNGKRIDLIKGGDLRPYRKEMQVVFQDPFASLNPRMNISEIIGEGLKAHNIGKSKAARDILIYKVLDEVGLSPEFAERYPHEFSGGQRQRIAIARAIILKPKLIILDEPTSALDMSVQAQIVDLLRKLQRDYKIAYIFISHDLSVVKAMSHKIIVMQNGDIVEYGSSDKILQNPDNSYTKKLIEACL